METFNKQQTYIQAYTAPFNYELFNVMNPFNVGDIVRSDRGKAYRVTRVETYKSYYDADAYYQTRSGGEGFKTVYGDSQKVTVQEYFERGTFQFAHYRREKNGFSIRIK